MASNNQRLQFPDLCVALLVFSSGNAKGLLDPQNIIPACVLWYSNLPEEHQQREREQSARLKWEGQFSLARNWTLGSEML